MQSALPPFPLPLYSPDLHLIESCGNKLGTRLRGVKARSQEALNAAITDALAAVTASDARLVHPLRLPRGFMNKPR